MTHDDVRRTLDSMKFWQKLLVYPLLAFAVAYWFILMGFFMVLCWPAIRFLKCFSLPGLPKPVNPPTLFPGKFVH